MTRSSPCSTRRPRDPERGIRVEHVFVAPLRNQLAELLAEFAARRLSTRVARTMPLAEAAQARQLTAAGGLRGKIVLVP